MASFRKLDDLDPRGKRVLVRVDFNVPMQDGSVTDATRIERAAPTLRALLDRGARVVVLSHFGRPKGKAEPALSLKPLVAPLEQALGGQKVAFVPETVGPDVEKAVAGLGDGEIVLLENLRFHKGEEKPADEPGFVEALAGLGDLYVNDAFSCSHRAHASITGLAEKLPAAAGLLMQAELEALEAALGSPKRPAAALIGGAKVSTKLAVLGHLLDKVDALIIGGGMANTFLHAKGIAVGKSLCERDMADQAAQIMRDAEKHGCRIVLPQDGVVATEFKPGAANTVVPIDAVPEDGMILDIGPATVEDVTVALEAYKTLLWNGPMGAFEIAPFDQGTNAIAKVAASLTQSQGLVTVAGGGDTVAALAHAGVLERFSYVSTAGGAFLEWLEGRELPGVAALTRRG
ncbi:phosphoglycerate kinase [Marinivivus vitaminiproducens]|uniref:phosphoglycerate kinase n=1 Tax=Marinivivus vitaminiproducens TaxID=3035935 RepID=UPI00279E12A8|nr:phosphoglycerate kinase [Geminicoccaceae bacterium SCSIO 64248]